ncbi:MAG: GSCFA domain-containing protein [Mucinivorans sp.]
MNLYTKVTTNQLTTLINHKEQGLIMGSCFAGVVGRRLSETAFKVTVNPLGVMFNPASIAMALDHIQNGHHYSQQELMFHNGMWHSPFHHGSFSGVSAEKVLEIINRPQPTHYQYMVLTLGTAYIYEHTGVVVANCHKMPATEFTQRMLSAEQVRQMITDIAHRNPQTNIILSVSPVRHLGDGLTENCLSKAILRVAVAQVCAQNSNCHYFPAYEIMVDELRDYRFYDRDMVHPSPQAEDIVWERFLNCCVDKKSTDFYHRVAQALSDKAHRPLHPESQEYQNFEKATQQRIELLKKEFPDVDFSKVF